ncbi:conserved protein, unknown function [Hepatocystis sp. ex Piliocolobus tephrosceles]|nr:conserved protein, unknown function [Hepatocystis sp. ex Piliocolobus tephrosceles]
MKILYICDTRLHNFNSKETKYLFKYWFHSLQDLINHSRLRNIKLWLVCISLIDYVDILNFTDLFNYKNVKNCIKKIMSHFQHNINDVHDKGKVVDPLLAFLKNDYLKIKECDKVAVLSSNIYIWADKLQELKFIGDRYCSCSCKFVFFNVQNKLNENKKKIEQLCCELNAYSCFIFKIVELNKINILQISKDILDVKFVVSFIFSLKNELLLQCEARPLITELENETYIGFNKLLIEFDIRAKALKEAISQHLIYGIPIFLSSEPFSEHNLISLNSLAKELYENEHVLILRSNINPIDLKMHEKEVRFLWVGTPMVKDENPVSLCLHGLSTQEIYSRSIEDCSVQQIGNIEDKENNKLSEMLNFLILIEEFNPLEYSNERFEYSFKFARSSLINFTSTDEHLNKGNQNTTLLKNNMYDSTDEEDNTTQEKPLKRGKLTKTIKPKNEITFKKDSLKNKKKTIPDPRSVLLTNINKAFQKNII